MNILCGCFAQYYAFVVTINPQGVNVQSDVPCGGWWGGAIGASKNKNEKDRVTAAFQNAVQQGQLAYNKGPASRTTTTPLAAPSIPNRDARRPSTGLAASTNRAVHASNTTPAPHTYPKGAQIAIKGLVSAKHLNGKQGKVLDFIQEVGRYEIEISDTKEIMRIKPGNVTTMHLPKGTFVLINGLVSAKHLNGKHGRVLDFVQQEGRYSVELSDTKDIVRLKPANISEIKATENEAQTLMVD